MLWIIYHRIYSIKYLVYQLVNPHLFARVVAIEQILIIFSLSNCITMVSIIFLSYFPIELNYGTIWSISNKTDCLSNQFLLFTLVLSCLTIDDNSIDRAFIICAITFTTLALTIAILSPSCYNNLGMRI